AFLLADRTMLIFGEQGVDLRPHRRVDDAGRYAIDVDAVLDEVEAGRLGEADDGGRGGAVDRHQRFTAAAGLRGHVDDFSAAAPRDHVPGDRLEAEEQAFDVDGEN